MRIETNVTRLLGIDLPILQAGMSWVSSSAALPIAVSDAGGLGAVAAGPMYPADLARVLDEVLTGTKRPFAVNVPLYRKGVEEILDLVLERRVPVLIASQGSPRVYVKRFKDAGIRCLHVVASEEHARKAAEAGVDGLIVVGAEAGGHPPPAMVSTLVITRAVARAVPHVPVIAAGGFVDGAGLVAALALGAGAASFGTRFLATHEASVHAAYKQKVVDAAVEHTRTIGRGIGVIRVLVNRFAEELEKLEQDGTPLEQRRTAFGASTLKMAAFSGDVQNGKVEAGQSAGLIDSIEHAGDLVRRIAAEYLAVFDGLPRPAPAPVDVHLQ